MEIERTVRRLGNSGEEESKQNRGKRRAGQNTHARGREMAQKKMSDFPLSSHKYFDKELGFYHKGEKKKSRGCLPEDPALLEFYDLILYKVAA